jgi:hypothetical protein
MKKQGPLHRDADVVHKVLVMDPKIVTFTFDDEIRLKRIVIDRDKDDALEFARELLGRISASANKRMKNHLDAG